MGANDANRVEGIGHIFMDTDLMFIPALFFDADGDGTWFEIDDAAEWANPTPISMEQWKAFDPFGFRQPTST
jgi:hypothetical protein